MVPTDAPWAAKMLPNTIMTMGRTSNSAIKQAISAVSRWRRLFFGVCFTKRRLLYTCRNLRMASREPKIPMTSPATANTARTYFQRLWKAMTTKKPS